jgi:hypothetical protein
MQKFSSFKSATQKLFNQTPTNPRRPQILDQNNNPIALLINTTQTPPNVLSHTLSPLKYTIICSTLNYSLKRHIQNYTSPNPITLIAKCNTAYNQKFANYGQYTLTNVNYLTNTITLTNINYL